MRGFGKVLAVAAMAVALAFGLAACGGSAGSKGSVYLKTKQVCYNTSDGSVQSEMTWEYDANGNKTKRVTKSTSKGSTAVIEDSYSDFDQDGYPGTHTAKNGSEERASTFEYKKEGGRVTKAVESNGNETVYSYHDDGKVKATDYTWSSGSTGCYEYDEGGYCVRNEGKGGSSGDVVRTIMWTKDDKGHPAEMVFNTTVSGKSQTPIKYTIQCDDNGNIIRVYDSLGRLYEECEYVRISSPSLFAWVEGNMISG